MILYHRRDLTQLGTHAPTYCTLCNMFVQPRPSPADSEKLCKNCSTVQSSVQLHPMCTFTLRYATCHPFNRRRRDRPPHTVIHLQRTKNLPLQFYFSVLIWPFLHLNTVPRGTPQLCKYLPKATPTQERCHPALVQPTPKSETTRHLVPLTWFSTSRHLKRIYTMPLFIIPAQLFLSL